MDLIETKSETEASNSIPAVPVASVLPVSVIVPVRNEARNLPRCLQSLAGAGEVYVIDSQSSDDTIAIAQSHGAKVVQFYYAGGWPKKRQWAMDTLPLAYDWILLLDADEVLTPELQLEIRQLLSCADGNEPQFGAYWIPRLNLYFGRWIRHGGFYPDHKLRLFRRGAARLSEGVGPHSTPQFAGPRGTLKGDMLHYAYPTLGIYLEHMDRYSSEIAKLLAAKGRTSESLVAFLWNAVANPAATFVYNYFFRLGFLDGREGLILHINHSVYIHWKFIKAWRIGLGKE